MKVIARSGLPLLIGMVTGLSVGIVLGASFGHAPLAWRFEGRSLEDWVGALHASSVETRTRAAYALGESPVLPEVGCVLLLEHLDDETDVREQVRLTLIHWARAGRCVAETVPMLSPRSPPEVRRLATDVLRGAGAQARPAAPALVGAALTDPVPAVRRLAAAALGGSGDTSQTVQDALAVAASDPDGDVRTNSVQALAGLPSSSDRLLRVARQASRDPFPPARAAAMWALEHVEVRESDLRRILIPALSDSAPEVRAAAATSLGWLRHGIGEARSALTRAARDNDLRVQNAAALSLFRLDRARAAVP